MTLADGTSTWLPGQVVTQTITLDGPRSPGVNQLIVAAYDPQREGNRRLVTAAGIDFVELAPTIWGP